MASIKKVFATIYEYTHLFVGAGAVVTSFLDTQQLPPKFAAGVVIASQALRVINNALIAGKGASPIAEKVAEAAVKEVESIVHPSAPVVVPAAPLDPATPQPTA